MHNETVRSAFTPSHVAYHHHTQLIAMSQSVAVQTASPRALRSRNRSARLDDIARASSTQPFEDALTGEEEHGDEEGGDNVLEFPQSNQNAANLHNLVFDKNNRIRRADPNQKPTQFPARPVTRTQVEVQFDENDPDTFLERLTSSGQGRRSKRRQVSEPQPEAQRQTTDLDRSSKRYNLRAQSSSAPTVEKKRKSDAQQVNRLFRGPIGSEDEEEIDTESEQSEEEQIGRPVEEQEGGEEEIEGDVLQHNDDEEENIQENEGNEDRNVQENEEEDDDEENVQESEEEDEENVQDNEDDDEEDTVMREGELQEEEDREISEDPSQSIPSPERAGAGIESEEEVDELEEAEEEDAEEEDAEEEDAEEEDAEEEEAVDATLELQRMSTSPSNYEEDSNEESDEDSDSYQEFVIDNDGFEEELDAAAIRKQKEQILKRRQSRSNPETEVQQQEESDEESQIEDDETERVNENSVTQYRYTIGQNNVGRKKWTDEETRCLMLAMNSILTGEDAKLKLRPYFAVLQLHGKEGSIDNLLASRNNLQLKDKVRNEILRMKRAGIEIPAWADTLFRTI